MIHALLIALASCANAHADATPVPPAPEHSAFLKKMGVVSEGVGLSTAMDLARLGLDGSASIFRVSAGAGVSWKLTWGGTKAYPFEIGCFIQPAVQADSGKSLVSVGVGISALFFHGFGGGFYYDAWKSGTGVTKFGKGTVGLTIPWGVTNQP